MVIELAHALGMRAVAEGVESADAMGLVRELGCDQAQGVFIAPPLDAVDVPPTARAGPREWAAAPRESPGTTRR